MIEWIIWAVSFLGLYVGIFWLHVISLAEPPKPSSPFFPRVSLIVPARNEASGLWKTVYSLLSLNYPKEKIEIIIVDHGSTDRTAEVGRQLIAEFPDSFITLVYKEHAKGDMKAHAFNEGLKYARGELVACVDADTIVLQDALKEMLPFFAEEKVGAVISTIKVHQPRSLYEKIQHLEYIFAAFTRSLMSKIDTLHVTPGALSVYRKKLFDLYGGFDEKNITEDLEMAMRLRYYGYSIKHARKSITYTRVPPSFRHLWVQRVRWFRGFIYNSIKYRGMLFKKNTGLLGNFQYPLNVVSLCTVLLMFGLLAYTFFDSFLAEIAKLQAIGLEYFFFFRGIQLKDLLLRVNVTLLFPVLVSFFVAIFIYHLAHKNLKEPWRFPLALVGYLTVYPLVRSCQWMQAVYEELFKARKKW